MPTWVIKATSPLGRLTKVFKVAVIVVKHVMECTIWLVAPVSMTQSVAWKTSLSTTLVEKIECLKEGVKGNNELVLDMVSTKEELTLSEGEMDEEVTPTTVGTPGALKSMLQTAPLVLTIATWWLVPWSILELKRASNYLHCALEIGHWANALEGTSTAWPWGYET